MLKLEEPPKFLLVTEQQKQEGYRTISPPDRISFTVLQNRDDGTYVVVNPAYEIWKQYSHK